MFRNPYRGAVWLTLWMTLASALLHQGLLAQAARILEVENTVQFADGAKSAWSPAAKDQPLALGDRIRTRQRSRATVALTGLFTLRLNQFTTVEITPGLVNSRKPKLDFSGGAAFIFSREPGGEMDVKVPGANAALRGTQLFVRVDPDGKSFVQVLEGGVDLDSPMGRLRLGSGEAGEAAPGMAPRRTAVIEASNLLQWALYYPAVIDPADLGLTPPESAAYARSLEAYQRGNLIAAASLLPSAPSPSSGGRIYHAAALVAVGRVDEARALVAHAPAHHPGRRSLERLIAAAQGIAGTPWDPTSVGTVSEAMAESYFLQSMKQLDAATAVARTAVRLAPRNGFAQTRLAELEFSAGRTREARAGIEAASGLTPDNARAHALRGFILCADNRISDARAAFERSVQLDGAFGNAWLGLGLTRIKQGDLEGGRADLQTAATVEPTSSIFHSYLGKAMSQDGRSDEALKDLNLARMLDPNDPTPPLYLALEHQRNNRTNAAIGELRESIRLNDNRRLYRSGFLLDQDRAVRSANLARIHRNAGMKEVAVREATRAVESDYTNASAHLFLANSFDALRDPDRILLRHETAWFNELLLSNLLSPVGGGPLSQFVSQQEYSKLLEADGEGGSLLTEWRSDSELRATASLFGTHGNVSHGIDAFYRNDDGGLPNSDIALKELYGQIKWQATPDDIVYFLGKWADQDQGDLFQHDGSRLRSVDFHFEENQQPGLLLGGWNHRWRPGSNTLFLAGRLAATQHLSDRGARQLLALRDNSGLQPGLMRVGGGGMMEFTNPALKDSIAGTSGGGVVYSPALLTAIHPYLGSGTLLDATGEPFDLATRRDFGILTSEIQHIERLEDHTVLLGGRWQRGEIDSAARMTYRGSPFIAAWPDPAVDQDISHDFERNVFYVYDYWRLLPSLTLVGGMTCDRIEHPENFRNPPLGDGQLEDETVSGKFGFTWTPSEWFTLRGALADGSGGLTYDESIRLEPSQIAGFTQAHRTVISESIAGSVEAPRYSIAGLGIEGWLPTRTWWGLSGGLIDQKVNRSLGMFTGYNGLPSPTEPLYFADQTPERLDYRETRIQATINQLLGDEFAVGAVWQVTRSDLETLRPRLQPLVGGLDDRAVLNEFSLFADWNSPHGFFARFEANAFSQDLDRKGPGAGSNPLAKRGDDFIQLNAWTGYRFHDNLCELAAGILNLGDVKPGLSPLSPCAELPDRRTVAVSLRTSF
jgi:tetratricopeptide (TPR) repeat protein